LDSPQIIRDTVTQYKVGDWSTTKYLYTGSNPGTWTTVSQVIDGNLIVHGTIGADMMDTGGLIVRTAAAANTRMELDGLSNSLSLIEYIGAADKVRVLIDDNDTPPSILETAATYTSPNAWNSGTVGTTTSSTPVIVESASRSLPAGRDAKYTATVNYPTIPSGDASYTLVMQGSTDNITFVDIYSKHVNDPDSGAITNVYFPTMGYTYHRIRGKFFNDNETSTTNYSVVDQVTLVYDQRTELNQGGCSWMGRYGWSRLGAPAVAAALSTVTHGNSVFESYGTADFWQVGSGGQNTGGNLMNFTLSGDSTKAWTMYMESDGDLIIVNGAGKGMRVSYVSGGVSTVS
jgi:hypothetical protein